MANIIFYLKKSIGYLGFLWLLVLLTQSVQLHGLAFFLPQNVLNFALATLLLLLSMLSSSLIFYLLVKADPKGNFSLRQLYVLHHFGQILRHLPGRFWGFAYQLEQAKSAEQRAVLTNANLLLMLLTLLSTLIAALLILGWYQKISLPVAASLLLCGLILMLLLLTRGIRWLFYLLQLVMPDRGFQWLTARIAFSDLRLPAHRNISIILVSIFSWSCYFFAWQTLADAFSIFNDSNMLLLSALYSLAWFIGFISVISPSGIGIREGSFFLLGAGQASFEVMVFLAAFIRLWLLLADFILGLFAWRLASKQSTT